MKTKVNKNGQLVVEAETIRDELILKSWFMEISDSAAVRLRVVIKSSCLGKLRERDGTIKWDAEP